MVITKEVLIMTDLLIAKENLLKKILIGLTVKKDLLEAIMMMEKENLLEEITVMEREDHLEEQVMIMKEALLKNIMKMQKEDPIGDLVMIKKKGHLMIQSPLEEAITTIKKEDHLIVKPETITMRQVIVDLKGIPTKRSNMMIPNKLLNQ
jgi:hypothetical protein